MSEVGGENPKTVDGEHKYGKLQSENPFLGAWLILSRS